MTEHRFSVEFSYPVIFADHVLGGASGLLDDLLHASGSGRCVAFVDDGLAAANPGIVDDLISTLGPRLALRPRLLRGGEVAKHGLAAVDPVLHDIEAGRIDRHATVIAVGGGALLDVVGFAASIAHRGVRLLRMPSTVLAQNDAGIGAKCGVNAFGKKNFLGSFYPPTAVINDFSLLATLPAARWRDGVAEAIKVALLRDPAFFEWIESSVGRLNEPEDAAFAELIRRCADLHLAHITTGGDPFERGSARPLDFGHWAAHKLETLSGYRISHGHAVAIGIAIDMTYARSTGLCPPELCDRALRLLRLLKFPLAGLMPRSPDDVLAGLDEFREHLGGRLSIPMIRSIGDATNVQAIDRSIMRRCVEHVLG